jgi:hypothetical protein
VIPGSRPVTVEVLVDDSWHLRRPVNDNEIIERPLYIGEITGKDVILAAADYSMLYQASSRMFWRTSALLTSEGLPVQCLELPLERRRRSIGWALIGVAFAGRAVSDQRGSARSRRGRALSVATWATLEANSGPAYCSYDLPHHATLVA